MNNKIKKAISTDTVKAYKTMRAARIAASYYRKKNLLLNEPFASFAVYRNKQVDCFRIALKLQF